MTAKQRLSLTASAALTGLLLAGAALADNEVPPGGPCDPLTNTFKNHGKYVSCVAHNEPPGSGAIISAAGRSGVGK